MVQCVVRKVIVTSEKWMALSYMQLNSFIRSSNFAASIFAVSWISTHSCCNFGHQSDSLYSGTTYRFTCRSHVDIPVRRGTLLPHLETCAFVYRDFLVNLRWNAIGGDINLFYQDK